MKISTTTGAFKKLKDIKAILRMIKESGFTAYDYSIAGDEEQENPWLTESDYLEKAKELRAYADSIGLPCNQTHAPFPSARKGDEKYNEEIFPKLVRAIEISGTLGASVCVVHPCNDYTAEENAERLYNRLAPIARKWGVKIGVENMWNWYHWNQPDGHVMPAACSHQDDFLAHMELLDKDVFTACVDIGHAEMMHAFDTDAPRMIERLGSYMGAMHLHDVDLVNDNHAYPFCCNIDYAPVIKALRKIGYQGDITMEAFCPLTNVPVELMSAAARYMAEIANYFKTQIEKE
ncbi:MAG: sugar phosphate isomerase/epimerase [Clostridia bacterium]|nr:sugar phosphate isomerase/epimerase [Clostridia bacterium]